MHIISFLKENMTRLGYVVILFLFFSCEGPRIEQGLTPPNEIPEPPYSKPIWHPSGQIIGFNHRPIKEIHYGEYDYQTHYIYDNDSIGFWLIDTDGANQRRVLPYILQTPSWSPNGKWIAFSQEAQIHLMPFDGEKFDTLSIIQITSEGRNYYPAWSFDGNKIAFSESICYDTLTCGIWIYNLLSGQAQIIGKYGYSTDWHPFSDSLVYLRNAINNKGEDIGDSIWLYDFSDKTTYFLKFISDPNYNNKYIKYSPDGKYLTFISALSTGEGIQLFRINADGSNLTQLTTEGCTGFSWSPDGEIVYVNFDYSITESKGTLWIMDSDGNNKQQLTYNSFNVIQ